ncbi:hypothetical protein EYB25_001010 [Talaromyces marneffei]|nr:hypothetical protein EYB25_001010 [Talaromyces marneffei]
MTEPDELEEDLFADLYDGNDNNQPTSTGVADHSAAAAPSSAVPQTNDYQNGRGYEPSYDNSNVHDTYQSQETGGIQSYPSMDETSQDINVHTGDGIQSTDGETQGTGIKEDGKMFIGGLNWETTDQSLKDYFSQFGEVSECTVMRDSATGRSRGFGFLTFRDPKTVNTVMVKEHYLDGKIIDPKRAIPRDEQEKTSKIFVGGVSQEATEQDFKQFFMQFGRVVDATLMIDKDTGRPRGFGFVTFDSEAAVEATLSRPLEILGKSIEVKKAQPRGNLRDDGGRRGRDQGMTPDNSQQQGGQGPGGMPSGITPQMMAQYWQRMQQYFAMMQQQMAAAQGTGMGGMNMAGMNPAMMQQMKQMQMAAGQQPGQSPSPGPQGMQNMMNNPAMMQQMQQMQQMQGQGQGQGQGQMGMGGGGYGANRGGPGYNAHEQLAFEQQKYEQQQARRGAYSPYQQGGPTSWEGMYDEVPQPNVPSGPQGRGGGNMGRGGMQNQGKPGTPGGSTPPAAPANAPTGPRNAGRPGANYRGGGRGGGHRGFHPYSR